MTYLTTRSSCDREYENALQRTPKADNERHALFRSQQCRRWHIPLSIGIVGENQTQRHVEVRNLKPQLAAYRCAVYWQPALSWTQRCNNGQHRRRSSLGLNRRRRSESLLGQSH